MNATICVCQVPNIQSDYILLAIFEQTIVLLSGNVPCNVRTEWKSTSAIDPSLVMIFKKVIVSALT